MPGQLEAARAALADGGLIVYPTDTLYGLGCLATDQAAFQRLLKLKGLPPGRGVSVLFSSSEAALCWVQDEPSAQQAMEALLPGPVTLIVTANEAAPAHLLGPAKSLGVRVVDRPETRGLAELGPLVATSANRHGEPSCVTIDEARNALGEAIEATVDAGRLDGPASTVIDVRGERPTVIREGALSEQDVLEAFNRG